MKKIIIFGTTAFAKLMHFYFTEEGKYEVVAFTVDAKFIKEETFCGLPVTPFEDIETKYSPAEHDMFVCVLAKKVNKIRQTKYNVAKEKGYHLASYISPSAILPKGMPVGDNCYIGEATVCKPFTAIGNNVILMGGVWLGHDVIVKDHTFMAARAMLLGQVTVEENCVIGGNVTVADSVTIERECIVGAGCVVLETTKPKQVLRANPPVVLPLTSDKLGSILFRNQQ